MSAVVPLIAILIICTGIVVVWMSRAPRIEGASKKKFEAAEPDYSERESGTTKQRLDSNEPKAKGA
jgi:hypothetical protein